MLTLLRWLLTFTGVVQAGIGAFFVVRRPPLLPEDARFIGIPAPQLLQLAPGLAGWLKRVFCVLGGHLTATGILVVYVANTGLLTGGGAALAVLAAVWATAIAGMAVVNVSLGSAFRWPLLVLAAISGTALALAGLSRL